MYKVLLLNSKNEIQDCKYLETYENAVRQRNEWQLHIEWQIQNGFNSWKTEIQKEENVTTITYSDKENRSHEHKII